MTKGHADRRALKEPRKTNLPAWIGRGRCERRTYGRNLHRDTGALRTARRPKHPCGRRNRTAGGAAVSSWESFSANDPHQPDFGPQSTAKGIWVKCPPSLHFCDESGEEQRAAITPRFRNGCSPLSNRDSLIQPQTLVAPAAPELRRTQTSWRSGYCRSTAWARRKVSRWSGVNTTSPESAVPAAGA